MFLSKSTYLSAVQCPKMLWLERNKPELFDDLGTDTSRLDIGKRVGELARDYFGDFAEVAYSADKTEMLSVTENLLEDGASVICEASFSFEGKYCSVDILRFFDDGVEIVEVKSSSGEYDETPDDIKEIYLHDLAYQYYILTNCGHTVRKISLMELNRKYVRYGDLDIQQLFTLTDCTEVVQNMQADIPERLQEIEKVALSESEPGYSIGGRCNSPYACGYQEWCWRHLPEHNVFTIGMKMWGSKKEAAYKEGLVSFSDVLSGGVRLNEKQRRQVESAVYDLSPHIDKPAIEEFLSHLHYPIYYFDFETFQQPIPLWDGVSPYKHIPFQYSLHIKHEDGTLIHKEFLGEEGVDPRRELAERICEDIPQDACTVAYYMSFEKARLRGLAELFPDLAEHLLSIAENMQDLYEPFNRGYYYCKEMGGSFSIKSVLPALFPNDPELDYGRLDLIQNGIDAMNAFANLHEKSPEEVEKIRNALLAYCKLDTLALVRILEWLEEVAG